MTDEYWKKRARELEQQHFEPAHITQQKIRVPQGSEFEQNPNIGNGWKDLNHGFGGNGGMDMDLSAKLTQRIQQAAAQQQMPPSMPSVPMDIPGQDRQTCFLREGHTAFRNIQADAPVEMAMNIGPIANVTGKEFVIRGKKKVYIVDHADRAVDLSNPDYSRMVELIAVEAPFVGTILVHENTLIRQGSSGQKLLKG